MTDRKRALCVSYLTAAFAVAIGFAVQGHVQAREYRQLLSNTYHHAFTELTTATSELDTALQKAQYATTTAMLSTLYNQVYAKALAAQYALGELPYSNLELEQTAAFFAKTGDYAATLARTDTPPTDESRQALKQLTANASALCQTLLSLQSDISAGSASLEDVTAVQARLAAATEGSGQILGGSSFQTIESDFPEMPTLIYDGPFSEHLSNRTPIALEGMSEVTKDEARTKAAAFLGLKPELFTLVSGGEGVLPTYSFSATVDGGEVYIEVTRQGGQVLNYFNSRPVEEAGLSTDEAITLAHNYLTACGYPAMRESYSINQSNILTIHFAATENDVLCYPDLVKVSIALDNGRLLGFESHGYLMNHTTRNLSAPQISTEDARAVVSPALTVLSHQVVVVPSAGEYEVLCHEFKCETVQGEHVIVYVNATTGGEEKILLLIEDESGTLAI